ncbi:phosphosulfolactate synthase [Heliorestis acidaminivorans]|uniref:Phosphosulfolactate synthase n=1 Tax=Heliorestis acidaminivorans TaxID=553427 RepID=A0A6I0F1T0_9FIRM|nr:phosphosulfolactate synthase [Heliorestis acidaminivorans]KAB2953891.1 phosphosulfolactate synthase [Heliorestis acidaminivorans]
MEKKFWWPPLSAWPIGPRHEKPRTQGITMVFDKGMGMNAFQDLLETAGEYIDFIKLGFGSAALYRSEMLAQKVTMARRYGVELYTGGTLTELAYWQGLFDEFLYTLRSHGIQWIEISDGTIHLSSRERKSLIQKAVAQNFKVLTEVGKKDPKKHLALPALIQQIVEDTNEGADYVIVEGRESGKDVNLYDEDGAIREKDMEMLVESLPSLDILLWEAPLKDQQQMLIENFGPNVNLGNIPSPEVIALESLRRGLRSDTLRQALTGRSWQEEIHPSTKII